MADFVRCVKRKRLPHFLKRTESIGVFGTEFSEDETVDSLENIEVLQIVSFVEMHSEESKQEVHSS